jgi:hypothetical protein
MKKLLQIPHFRLIGSILVINLVFFAFTNPVKANSALLGMGFVLLTADVYIVVRAIIWGCNTLLGHRSKVETRSAALISATIVLLVALQSVGELSAKDAIAIIIIALVSLFYISYRRPR